MVFQSDARSYVGTLIPPNFKSIGKSIPQFSRIYKKNHTHPAKIAVPPLRTASPFAIIELEYSENAGKSDIRRHNMETKRTITRTLSLLLALCLLLGLAPHAFAAEITASGACGADGDNLTWTLDSDGLLSIEGSGAMADYTEDAPAPWRQYQDQYLLKTLYLDDRITEIGDYAFYQCYGFRNIALQLPSHLTRIGDCAFYALSFTGPLNLPVGLREIGREAFSFGSKYTGDLIIPEGVVSIGDNAFSSLDGLTGTLSLPSTLRTIGASAFQSCENLAGALVLPDGVEEIGDRAFKDCSGFSGTLRIPGSVRSIGEYSFADCAFTGLTLEYGLESIGDGAFVRTPLQGELWIPDSVTFIDDFAFDELTGITSVRLSSGLKTIKGSFAGTGLTGTLTIPDGVTEIEPNAFKGCAGLTKLELPNTLQTIRNNAFDGCTGLRGRLRLPEGLTRLCSESFLNCTGLTGVTLPKSMQYLEDSVFEGCSSLRGQIVFWDNIKEIGVSAFDGCPGITAFCFNGDAPTKSSITAIWGEYMGHWSFPQGSTVCFREGMSGWTDDTKRYNAETGLWDGYKLQTWNGIFEEKDVPQDETPVISDNRAQTPGTSRLFRIYVPGTTYGTAPVGFRVTVDGKTFTSGLTYATLSEDIEAQIPEGYTGNVVISREGFHTYEMPAQQTRLYTPVVMTPSSVTAPFAQTLLCGGTNLIYYGSSLNVFQPTPGTTAETHDLYAKINWNGHGEGRVWLQQGSFSLPILDGDWATCRLAENLVPGEPVYLCAKAADGASLRVRTTIHVYEPVQMDLGLDLGSVEVPTDAAQDALGPFDKMALELDFSSFTENVPIKVSFCRDGTLQGVIGIKPISDKASEAAYGDLKESFSQLMQVDETGQSQSLAAALDALKAGNKNIAPLPKHGQLGVAGSVQVLGIFSGNVYDGKVRITEMQVAFVGSASVSYTYNTVILNVPAYFKAQLTASLQTALRSVYDEHIDELVPQRVPLDFSLALTLGVGPGWEGYFSCGVQGAGQIAFYGYIPMVRDDITAAVSGNLCLVGTLSGISGEWKICSTKEMVFWENNDFTWHEKTPVDDSIVTHAFQPDTSLRAMRFAAAQPDGTVAADVSGYNAPCLTQLPDGRLLAVWTADVQGRSVTDRGGIYYSVRTDGVWQTPALVWDDGTNDFAPVLQSVDGEIWLLWQNYTKAWNAADPSAIGYEVLAADCDVAAARFDLTSASFMDASNLSCAGYDYAPRLAVQDGAVTAAWTNGSSVWTASRTDGIWAAPAQSAAAPGWYSFEEELPSSWEEDEATGEGSRQCFTTNDYEAIVYTAADENGRNQVYALWNDGYGWGEPFALTDVQTGSIGGFTAVLDGQNHIQILANVCTFGDDGSYQSADLVLFEQDLRADLTVSAADYVRNTYAPGQTLTLTASVTNRSAQTVQSVRVAALDGEQVLAEQTFGLTLLPGQTKTAYLNYDLPADSALSGVTLRVLPAAADDADASDNTALCTFQRVDLSVETVSAVQLGTQTQLLAQIVNRGRLSSAPFQLTFRRTSPDGEILGTQTVGALAPGALHAAELTLDEALPDGEIIYAEVGAQSNENLYANNRGQCIVLAVSSQPELSQVSERFADGSLTLDLTLTARLPDGSTVVAAAYDSAGKLLRSTVAASVSNGFTASLKLSEQPASWKFFFLDSAGRPLRSCITS